MPRGFSGGEGDLATRGEGICDQRPPSTGTAWGERCPGLMKALVANIPIWLSLSNQIIVYECIKA